MVWLPDGEKNLNICLFVLTWSTNVKKSKNSDQRWKNRRFYVPQPTFLFPLETSLRLSHNMLHGWKASNGWCFEEAEAAWRYHWRVDPKSFQTMTLSNFVTQNSLHLFMAMRIDPACITGNPSAWCSDGRFKNFKTRLISITFFNWDLELIFTLPLTTLQRHMPVIANKCSQRVNVPQKISKICLFICVCVCTALIDGRTDRQTLCDSKDHAYASHRAVKTLLGMNSLVWQQCCIKTKPNCQPNF